MLKPVIVLLLCFVPLAGCGSPEIQRPPTSEGPAWLVGFDDVVQVAVITPDVDGTIRDLRRALGAGSFKVVNMQGPELFNAKYNGSPEDWRMTLGISWIGNMQIEVIQPTAGKNLFRDYLESRGGRAGVQHVFLARKSFSYAEAIESFGKANISWKQEAQVNSSGRLGFLPMPALPGFLAEKYAARFGYTGSIESLKVDVEMAEFPPGVSHRLALRAAVPTRWIPDDDADHFEIPTADAVLRDIDSVYVFGRDLNALVSAYSRLTDRKPTIEAYSDDQLPGKGRLARINLSTTSIILTEPASGELRDLLASPGEGVALLRGRPAGDLKQTSAALAGRGWTVLHKTLQAATGQYEAILATHPGVPFALWVHASRE